MYPSLDAFPVGAEVVPQLVLTKAADGTEIHNQLFLPTDLKPGEKRPAIVFVRPVLPTESPPRAPLYLRISRLLIWSVTREVKFKTPRSAKPPVPDAPIRHPKTTSRLSMNRSVLPASCRQVWNRSPTGRR